MVATLVVNRWKPVNGIWQWVELHRREVDVIKRGRYFVAENKSFDTDGSQTRSSRTGHTYSYRLIDVKG